MGREFGLIGWPLGHSFSAKYFAEKFRREGIKACYRLLPIADISELSVLLSGDNAPEGLNVTIPYKEAVIPYLNDISDDAREIGAVNVLKITYDSNQSPYIKGYNSDWEGFAGSLRPLLRKDVTNSLVLGSGGAAKAVVYALRRLGITPTIVSRNPQAANGFSSNIEIIGYSDLTAEIIQANQLIVNTTPLGMSPNTMGCPDIPYESVTARHICYDLIYNPAETTFMRRCHERGAIVKNGLEMLERQAEISWEIWK